MMNIQNWKEANMRRVLHCLFLLIPIIGVLSVQADNVEYQKFSDPVVIGANHSSSAYHGRTAEGEVEGFAVDVIKYILAQNNIPYSIYCSTLFYKTDHDPVLGSLDVKLDAVSDVRVDSLYYYSDTLYVGHPSLFVLSSSSCRRAVDVKTDALCISTNCVLKSTANSLGFKLDYSEISLSQRVRLLLSKSITGIIVDREEMYAFIAEHKLEGVMREIPLGIEPHVHRIAVAKHRPDLYAVINKELIQMKRDGEWAILEYKWLSITGEKYRLHQVLAYAALILAGLCVLAFFYLIYLYHKKRSKIAYLEQNDLFEVLVENLPFDMHLSDVRVQEQSNFNMIVVKDEAGEARHLKKGYIWVPVLDRGTTIHLSYDVTEYINGLNRQEEAERTKSILLANMSHDIRSPLNGVVGFSDLLIQTPIENKEEIAEYKDIIVSSSQLMHKLFQDILDISRLRTDSMTFEPTHTDLCAVMRQVDAHYNKALEGRDVRFDLYQAYEKMYATLDKDRLLQVIHNIVGNASKYTQKGTISAGLIDEGDYLLFFCWDTGIGISKERQQQVFQRFAKLDEIAKGTGLGMAICKSIADTLQGELDFVSQEGTGTLFWYRIPVLVDSSSKGAHTDWSVIHKVLEQIKTKRYLAYEE